MVEVIYSPVCEKLPLVREAAEQYGFTLQEINLWDVNGQRLLEYPTHIQTMIQQLWSGEDGFYAWKVFEDGLDITREFEMRYPMEVVASPELNWNGDIPTIDHWELEVKPLTMELLDEGLNGPGAFCLGPLQKGQVWTELRRMRRELFAEVVRRIGCFGLTVQWQGLTLGFINFLPKDEARRAGYYTARQDEGMAQTLVVSCLYIPGELRGEGLATRLIAEMKKIAPGMGFNRIEVAATHRFFDEEYTWWSKDPFMKAGFTHIEDRDYADAYPSMAIWGWEMVEG